MICSCDIGDAAAVAEMGKRVFSQFGAVELLVNAAGINAKRRLLNVLSLNDYHAMINTNLQKSVVLLFIRKLAV